LTGPALMGGRLDTVALVLMILTGAMLYMAFKPAAGYRHGTPGPRSESSHAVA
jgi:hypothetical protein